MASDAPRRDRRPRAMNARRWAPAGGLLVLAVALIGNGRVASFAGVALLGVAVLLLSHRSATARSGTVLSVFVGAAPTFVLVGTLHDRLATEPAAWVSALALATVWVAAARTFGASVSDAVLRRRGGIPRDVWMRITAVGAVMLFFAIALIRHLLPGVSVATRLGWIVGEEDNANMVGIAREILMSGPNGERLAEQIGTAFMNVPLLVVRLLGGPLRGDDDARLQAITLFTVSAIVVTALAGLAIALLTALPHHIHPGRRKEGVSPLHGLVGALAAAAVTTISLSLLLVLPMRTGFLTFVWGLTLTLLAAACVVVMPESASGGSRAMVIVHLLGTVLLLLSSWPFILPALAPLLLLPLLWVRWRSALHVVHAHRARSTIAIVLGLVVLAAGAVSFTRWGPAAEVLSYGRNLLVISGSSIRADRPAWSVAAASIVLAAFAILALTRNRARVTLLLAIVAPILGGGVLYVGLRIAADLLTDGALDYAGQKLLYGIVTLALVLGLTALGSVAGRVRTTASVVLIAGLIALHSTSSTASVWTSWWARTDLGEGPHVVATIEAIRSTNEELPIRCLPSPSTPVTPTSRLAIYYCIRWMEDAFNEGAFQGFRDELQATGDETFGPIVEQVVAEAQGEYLFSYRFTMGPGWYGWQGPGT